MLPFEFVVYRSPVSQQARRRELVRQWTQEVHNASDDAAVTDLICRKRNLKDDPQISNASPILRQSLNRNVEFVYVFIGDAPIREANF